MSGHSKIQQTNIQRIAAGMTVCIVMLANINANAGDVRDHRMSNGDVSARRPSANPLPPGPPQVGVRDHRPPPLLPGGGASVVHDHRTGSSGVSTGRPPANPPPPGSPQTVVRDHRPPPMAPHGEGGTSVKHRPPGDYTSCWLC